MDTTDDLAKKASSSYLYLAFIPVPLIILLIAALHLASPTHPVTRLVFEPPLILPILNTVFLFIVACVVSYIAMRAYLVAGSPTTLLLGCGVLTLGTGALFAGWLIGPGGPNATATVFNVSALVASIFHIIAALVDFTGKRLETDQKRKQRKLVLGYLSVVVFVVILSALSDAGITPPFFVQGKGPTALRQVVLATALHPICHFLLVHDELLYQETGAILLLVLSGPRTGCNQHGRYVSSARCGKLTRMGVQMLCIPCWYLFSHGSDLDIVGSAQTKGISR